jgi:hypothetical protein
VLWIRIGFTADPDPAFYFNVVPDPDPGSQTNADPIPNQTLKLQKVQFLKYWSLKLATDKNFPTMVQKPFWKAGNQVYFLVLVSFYAS